jgi:hypothetical protein
MNKKILDIVEKYSIELNFEKNLKNLIKNLKNFKNKHKHEPLEYSIESLPEYYLDTNQENLFEEMLKKTIPTYFFIKEFSMIHRSHGGDDNSHTNVDIIRYVISYSLNNYEINFLVEIEEYGNNVILFNIEIKGVIEYSVVSYSGDELGENHEPGETGLIYYNKQNAANFYHEFNDNIFESSRSFYKNFVEILLSSVEHKLSCDCDDYDGIELGDDFEDIPYDNSFILK